MKRKKGDKTTSLSAFAKDSRIGKSINHEKKGEAELTVIEAGDKGRGRVSAKDPGLKVELEGEVDVVLCE